MTEVQCSTTTKSVMKLQNLSFSFYFHFTPVTESTESVENLMRVFRRVIEDEYRLIGGDGCPFSFLHNKINSREDCGNYNSKRIIPLSIYYGPSMMSFIFRNKSIILTEPK